MKSQHYRISLSDGSTGLMQHDHASGKVYWSVNETCSKTCNMQWGGASCIEVLPHHQAEVEDAANDIKPRVLQAEEVQILAAELHAAGG